MLTILATAIGTLALIWLVRARAAAAIAMALVLFTLSYRMIDIAYLDLFGPVYSIQLEKFVGGGASAPFFVAAMLCLIVPLAYFFRPSALLSNAVVPLPSTGYLAVVNTGGLVALGALLAAMYGNMVRVGVIPLFVGMDRIQYNEIAGPLHTAMYGLGFLPATALGFLAVLPRLQGRGYGATAIIMFASLLFYWALTGNRFSAFQLAIAYFLLPFAAVAALHQAGWLKRGFSNDPWAFLVTARVVVPVTAILMVLAICGLIVNSYFEVRNYADPVFQMTQRILVQPSEIFVARWEDALISGRQGFDRLAFEEVLLDPEEPDSNTTMRYLMILELGYFRAVEVLFYGTQFTGGYPEIFIELFGFYWTFPLLIACGIAAAALARLAIKNCLRGYMLSALMAVYVSFALTLTYLGGMLNSLIAPSFAAKILILIIVTQFERHMFERERASARGNLSVPPPYVPEVRRLR